MKVLLDLSEDHLALILVHWLDISCIGRLDSAFCCSLTRPAFMQLIQTKCIFKRCTIDSESIIAWVLIRGCQFHSIEYRKEALQRSIRRETFMAFVGLALQSISVDGDSEDSDDFSQDSPFVTADLAIHCPAVRRIQFCNEEIDSNFSAVFFRCPHLTHLSLSSCSVTCNSLLQLACYAPHLAELFLLDVDFDLDMAISPHVKCLSMRKFSIHQPVGLTEVEIVHLCANFPNLVELYISDVNITSVLKLAGCSSHLRKAAISYTGQLTDALVSRLALAWSNLEELSIPTDEYTSATLLLLLRSLPSLTRLMLTTKPKHGWINASSRDTPVLTPTSTKTQTTTALTNTTAKHTNTVHPSMLAELVVNRINDETLKSVIKMCPKIQFISTRSFTDITKTTLLIYSLSHHIKFECV